MSNEVTFEEEDSIVPERIVSAKKKSLFTRILIKLGLAKDEKQAQMVLLVIAGIGIAITIFNIFTFLLPHH